LQASDQLVFHAHHRDNLGQRRNGVPSRARKCGIQLLFLSEQFDLRGHDRLALSNCRLGMGL
jgi:hypothetical protein